MATSDWLPAIAIIAGGGGIGTAIVASLTTRKVEYAKNLVLANQQELDVNRQKLEGWAELVSSLQAENERKDRIIQARDEVIQDLLARIREEPL